MGHHVSRDAEMKVKSFKRHHGISCWYIVLKLDSEIGSAWRETDADTIYTYLDSLNLQMNGALGAGLASFELIKWTPNKAEGAVIVIKAYSDTKKALISAWTLCSLQDTAGFGPVHLRVLDEGPRLED